MKQKEGRVARQMPLLKQWQEIEEEREREKTGNVLKGEEITSKKFTREPKRDGSKRDFR